MDFLVDPDDQAGLRTLLGWVDREARQADSDKIRTFAMHAGFRRVLRRAGYFQVKSTMQFVVKVNGINVPPVVLRRTPIAGTSRSATRIRTAERRPLMHLLVGIDTEGDNQWDAAARAHQTFENIYALPRLHALFARHGVRPTYVITHPVATDPRSAEVLRALLAGGRLRDRRAPSRLGDAAVHGGRRAAACVRVDAAAAAVRGAAGGADRAPSSERSACGRCRTDRAASDSRPITSRHSSSTGYLVESSVAPLFYEAHKGGPEFVEAPLTPYFLAYDNATRAGIEQPARSAGQRRR